MTNTSQDRSKANNRNTYAVTEEGLERANSAYRRGGYNSKKAFAELCKLSKSTVDKFFGGAPIEPDCFKAIHKTLEMSGDWKEIADIENFNANGKVESESNFCHQAIDDKKVNYKISVDKKHQVELLNSLILLARKLGDDSIKIIDIEEGSIKLTLKGSLVGLKRLEKLFQSGELNKIFEQELNITVENVRFINPRNSAVDLKNEPTTTEGTQLAFTIAGDVSQADIDILKAALVDTSNDDEEIKNQEKSHLIEEIRNRGAKGQDLSGANLSGANLSGAILSGAILSGANLSGANLSGANLSGKDLSQNGLVGVILIVTNLSGADLSDADLSDADLSNTYLSGANLSGADLNGADLRNINLSGANLSNTNLSNTNWSHTSLVCADLSNTYLKNANLSNTYLKNADLGGANLSSANLNGADLSGANLSDADLSGANLSGANLDRSWLKHTKIDNQTQVDTKWRFTWKIVNRGARGQDLSGADLSGANLSDADLSGANLSDADLSGANLSGANLKGANLNDAKVKNTYFGDNSDIPETTKRKLESGGAIFEDSPPNDFSIALSPV